MKKIIEFLTKHRVKLLSFLVILLLFRSCNKSSQLKRLNKEKSQDTLTIDSLNYIIKNQRDTINGFPQKIKTEKHKIHSEYDNWISEKNRGQQLMELHFVVKNKLKELQEE